MCTKFRLFKFLRVPVLIKIVVGCTDKFTFFQILANGLN